MPALFGRAARGSRRSRRRSIRRRAHAGNRSCARRCARRSLQPKHGRERRGWRDGHLLQLRARTGFQVALGSQDRDRTGERQLAVRPVRDARYPGGAVWTLAAGRASVPTRDRRASPVAAARRSEPATLAATCRSADPVWQNARMMPRACAAPTYRLMSLETRAKGRPSPGGVRSPSSI